MEVNPRAPRHLLRLSSLVFLHTQKLTDRRWQRLKFRTSFYLFLCFLARTNKKMLYFEDGTRR